MKLRSLIIFLLIVNHVSISQEIKHIGAYFIKEDLHENLNYFKIGGVRCSFDTHHNFYLKGKLLFSYSKDSTAFFEVYKKRYLLVSYYLWPKDGFGSALGPSARNKGRMDIFDLKRPDLKWSYDLENNYRTGDIVSFDSEKGVLTLQELKKSSTGENNFWRENIHLGQ